MNVVRAIFVQVLLAPIRLYKRVLSPLLPPACRYHPSCSVYAMGAIAVHGPVKGSWLAVRRVARCQPLFDGGLDPVPPKDGVDAVTLLTASEPELARRLSEPPPPYLAGVLKPRP